MHELKEECFEDSLSSYPNQFHFPSLPSMLNFIRYEVVIRSCVHIFSEYLSGSLMVLLYSADRAEALDVWVSDAIGRASVWVYVS